MKSLLGLAAFACCLLHAQPNPSGVWKANLEKSKLGGGPAPTGILMLIDVQGTKLTQTVGMASPRGEQRATFTYNLDGKPSTNLNRGLPTRTTARMEGGSLVLESKVAAAKPGTMTEKWTMSDEGKTMTVESSALIDGREMKQALVLEKQPDAAGDDLRKPEQTAGERFKNVTIMKDVPASRFLDAMRTFNWSLGVNCEFCHVQGQMQSDEKKEKTTARHMLTMTSEINKQAFAGKLEVRCYTCHGGQKHPASYPKFE
jgi:hypothetical protein